MAMRRTNATPSTYNKHSHAIYDDPAILKEIPTLWCWKPGRAEEFKTRQQTTEPKNFACTPGSFASAPEFLFYRAWNAYCVERGNYLLSNLPLSEIVHLDDAQFDEWYGKRNYEPAGLADSRGAAYTKLIGNKSVDFVEVDGSTGALRRAYEVDGPSHISLDGGVTDQMRSDLTKSSIFRQHDVPMFRICADGPARMRTLPIAVRALQTMEENWRAFVNDLSIRTMQLHLSTPVIAPLQWNLPSSMTHGTALSGQD